MEKVKGFVTKYSLPILSGLLIGTSYIPFPPWALLACLVPLWSFWLAPNRSLKEVLIGGWITQFLLSLIGFHWIAYTAHEFGHFPWAVSILVLLAFCAFAHLYFPIAGALWLIAHHKLKLPYWASILALCLIFALSEQLWPSIFQWNLGYPYLWAGLPIYQLADIIGFDGLSVFSIFANAAIFHAWRNRKNLVLCTGSLALLLGLFLLLNIAGSLKKEAWSKPDQSLKVLQVQGNIGNLQKQQAEKGEGAEDEILKTYFKLSEEGLKANPDTDLIIWPETAFPSFLDPIYWASRYSIQLRRFIRAQQTALLAGAYSRDEESTNGKLRSYNAIFLLDKDAQLIEDPYRKTHLLAFGEYFPGRQWVPQVEEWFPMVSNFGRGQGPKILNFKDTQLGPQICYEGLYPAFSRKLAQQGAEVFVNVTNDSWFGGFFEAYQHLYMTYARAIENRRPLIRNTNTGITSAILSNGEILKTSPVGEEWTGAYEIDYYGKPELTFYSRFGHLWLPFWILALILVLFLGGYGARARKSRLD